jgi:calcineurin-like phosphoesterase family protein/purple acid phosphatase-like protein
VLTRAAHAERRRSGVPTDGEQRRERRRSGWLNPIASLWGVATLLFAASCVGIFTGPPDFDTQPYIGHTTTTTSTISWVTKEPSIGRLRFGAYPGELDQVRVEATPQRIHELRLDGLVPNTRYRYRVEPSAQEGGSGAFWTAPSTTDAFSFVVLGDTRFDREAVQTLVRQIIQQERDRRFVFNLGDMVNDGESLSEWKVFFEDVAPLARFSPYYSTLGNHERNADLYFELFSLPRNGSHPERNYSFDYGNTHFTVIDSNKNYRDDEGQLEWLDQDLQRAQSATFRIVFFHHSGHGTRPDRINDHEEVSRLLDPYFERGHVTLVFNAHDHNYVHASKNGIDYIVTGGGGAPLHELGPPTDETIVQYKIHHYCRVTVSPDTLEVVAIDSTGRPIDSFVRRARRP